MNIRNLLNPAKHLKKSAESDGFIDLLDDGNCTAHNGFTPETVQYQGKYHSSSAAQAYNRRYRHKRARTTQRESVILRKLLSKYNTSETVLDLPCGGGRLSPVIGEFTRTILEMDLAPGQLLYGLKNCKTIAKQIWIRASAFDIPLRDNSVDGTVCIRLSHHLYSMEEKEKLLAELLRVARRFVVFYFVDSNAPKYKSKELRASITGNLFKKNSMTIQELIRLTEKLGAKIVSCPASGFLQPHRYALIEKQPDAHAYV